MYSYYFLINCIHVGTEIDVDIVGEKIINKQYTPDFLKGLLSDDSDYDDYDVTTDCTCASDSDIAYNSKNISAEAKSTKRNAKRKRTDSNYNAIHFNVHVCYDTL